MRSARQTSKVAFRNVRHFCVAIVCFFAAHLSHAQTKPSIPPADRKVIEITATGSKRFTSAQIAAASGLMIGTIADENDFRNASRHLGESGAFNDISYTFSYSSKGTKLAFQVADADKFVPAHFLDFVWFSDQDLQQKVRARVPLFDGELPANGRLPDQVSDVLQALLVEGAIPGHVDYLRTEGKDGHLGSIDYSVSNVTIRIDHVSFTGAGPDELPQLQSAAAKLSSREYSHPLLTSFVDQVVLPLYHERGYLKAACAAPQPEVVAPAHSDSDHPQYDDPRDEQRAITHVNVTIPITSGLQYKVTGWTWSGNQAIPTNTLQPMLHSKTGQPANIVQLEDDLRAVQQLYGSHGFVTASIKANAEYDDAAQTVAYELLVTEGAVFHMGELAFRGIDNNLEARLRAAWRIRPGDVYDASYLSEFLPRARKLLPPSIDWEVSTHVTAIAKDKTVDVDLQYTGKAPR
ncbi:MAG: POTRA domain-containing protein [Candidatus Sulfotelmatobacter sp.]